MAKNLLDLHSVPQTQNRLRKVLGYSLVSCVIAFSSFFMMLDFNQQMHTPASIHAFEHLTSEATYRSQPGNEKSAFFKSGIFLKVLPILEKERISVRYATLESEKLTLEIHNQAGDVVLSRCLKGNTAPRNLMLKLDSWETGTYQVYIHNQTDVMTSQFRVGTAY